MRLLNFIFGVFGVFILIGALSYFLPLVFLGGIFSGSILFAFVLPICLIILGASMVYFGFYYHDSTHKSNKNFVGIIMWGALYTLAILISNYIVSKLMITNSFLIILFTALFISIVIQAIRSHEYNFKFNWFVFYFLVYATIIWIFNEFILPQIFPHPGFSSSLVLGFALNAVVLIIQRTKLSRSSLPWISFILIFLLLVSNIGNLNLLQGISLGNIGEKIVNNSGSSEDKQSCPSPTSTSAIAEMDFNPESAGRVINSLINSSVWKIENNIRSCYQGKYVGQYPDWFYCVDLIVSRWEKSSSGTINYRWYTVVISEWKPEEIKLGGGYQRYILQGFSCEDGRKLVVTKDKTNYTVFVSRDGTQIKINY